MFDCSHFSGCHLLFDRAVIVASGTLAFFCASKTFDQLPDSQGDNENDDDEINK